MSGLSADRMSSILTELNSQISSSVKNIRQKAEPTFNPVADNSNTPISGTSWNSAGINSYAFSYLEPNSLSYLQKTLQQQGEGQRLQKQQQQQVLEDNQDKTNSANGTIDNVDGIEFRDELYNFTTAPSAKSVAQLYLQNSGQKMELPINLGRGEFAMNDAAYAHNMYNYNFSINQTPNTKIEFMDKYNRSFDYRV